MQRKIRKTNPQEEERKSFCAEQLAQDRQILLMRWPFIGGIIIRQDLIPVRDDRLETAATDGDRIFVDIDFYSRLSLEERLFVLAHEVWHCVFLHFARKGDRDLDLFNYAADLEIHFTLNSASDPAEARLISMKEPWVLPHDPKWKSLSAEEIYEKLLEIRKKEISVPEYFRNRTNTGKTSCSQNSIPCSGKENPKFGSNTESFDKHIYNSREKNDNMQDDSGKKEFVMDDDYTPSISDETIERTRGRVISSAQRIERRMQGGKLPGKIAQIINQLQTPSLPWQEMLKQFLTSCYGGKRRWLPPSRRHVWQDLYLPSMRDEQLNAVVALDTSGSTIYDLSTFFGELESLLKSFGKFDLTVLQCDAAVAKIDRYTEAKMLPAKNMWKSYGGGGTSFVPVFDYVKKNKLNPDVLLYFTDGYGTAPVKPPAYPVMWIITKGGKKPCSWGRAASFK